MGLPRLRSILIAFLVILLVGSFAAWRLLQSDMFWRWAGRRLVNAAQGQINGTLDVKEIQGNPINGLFFEGVSVSTPQAEVFKAKSLEIRLSLWSVVKLQPVVGKLALSQPYINLEQDEADRWNVSRLLPEKPKEEPQAEKKLSLPLRSLSFRQILIRDGEIVITQKGTKTRYQDVDLDLAFSVFHPLKPEQTLKVSKASLAVTTPQGRFDLATRLTFKKQRLDLYSLILNSKDEQILSLAGKVNLAKKKGDIQIKGLLGPVKGKTISRFSPQWPVAWDFSGKVQVKGTLAQVHLSLDGKIHQSPYAIKGILSQKAGKWLYDITFNVKGLKPEILAAVDKSWAEKSKDISPITARLHAKGTGLGWPLEQFAYALELKPFSYGPARFEQLKITLGGTDKQQDIAGVIQGNFGKLTLSSKGSFFKAPEGNIQVQAESLRPDLLGLGAPPETSLNAKFAGSFRLPDIKTLDRLKVTGQLEASGQVGPHPLKELKGRVAWEKPNLRVPQFRLHLGNLMTELKGSLERDRLDFSLKGKSTPGGTWPLPASLDGQITWEGTLGGRLKDPRFAFQAKGRNLAYEQYRIRSFTLTAKGESWPLRSGQIDVRGAKIKTPAGVITQASFQSRMEADRWVFQLKATSPKGPRAEIAGRANLMDRPIEVTMDLFQLGLYDLSCRNVGPVQVRFLPGLELQPATFEVNKGTVNMEARIQGTQVAGRLEVKDLPTEVTGLKDLQGKVQGKVTLAGTAAKPVIQGEMRVEPLQWRNLMVKFVRTDLSYQDAAFQFKGNMEESAFGARVLWDGRLPMVLSFSPFKLSFTDQDLKIRLQGEGVNLGMLAAFSKEVEEAEGPLNFRVEVKGTQRRPQVSGQVKWSEGYITLSQAGIPYRLQPGVINLQGNRVSIPQLTLTSQGTARLQGDIKLAGFMPDQIKARFQLDNFKVLGRLRSEAFINGSVSIDGPWSGLAVQGQVTIPNATLNPKLAKIGGAGELNKDIVLVDKQGQALAKKAPAEAAAEPSFMKNMRIAVTIDAPSNLWVVDKQVKVELTLRLRIKKRPMEKIIVGGMIRSLRGDIDVYGRTFKLVKGIVNLPEVPQQEPYLEARAIHEMIDVTIIVNVSGTPSNPKLDLTSQPSLPRSEILSYLVFGRPSSDLSEGEFNAKNLAAGALGGFTTQKIQEILGEDFPLLRDVTVKSGKTLGIVKPLTKGLTLSFERNPDPIEGEDANQVKLRYRINRFLSLEAQKGTRNTGGDIFFNYDF